MPDAAVLIWTACFAIATGFLVFDICAMKKGRK